MIARFLHDHWLDLILWIAVGAGCVACVILYRTME